MTDNAAAQVVNTFMTAVNNKDAAAALDLLSDEIFYDCVPIGSTTGKRLMVELLTPMWPLEYEILRQTATGNTVMVERVNRFTARGKDIAIPATGVFEVNDGLITFWRDYFDNGAFLDAFNSE